MTGIDPKMDICRCGHSWYDHISQSEKCPRCTPGRCVRFTWSHFNFLCNTCGGVEKLGLDLRKLHGEPICDTCAEAAQDIGEPVEGGSNG